MKASNFAVLALVAVLLAETLKYLSLLFSDEPVDVEKVVFNTEAHPLRRTW